MKTDSPPSGARILARDLTVVHRDGTIALDAVGVEIEPGAVTAVIGHSGAGKTTLLATLAGVSRATDGQVSIETSGDGPVRIGYVPQDDILHGELPLRRTLRYAAALRLDTSDRVLLDAAVHRVLASLGLEHHAHSLRRPERRPAHRGPVGDDNGWSSRPGWPRPSLAVA
jgi:ABC-type multidrug transport system ATPase subunit